VRRALRYLAISLLGPLLELGCASPLPMAPPDTPVVVQDPAACAAACAHAQGQCANPTPIDSCVEVCQQAAPDLEGSLDSLAVTLTCTEAP